MEVEFQTSAAYPQLLALPKTDRAKIFSSIEMLLNDNPNLPAQLEKLASLKKDKPKQFEAGIKFLKL